MTLSSLVHVLFLSLLLSACALLAACGGGGSSAPEADLAADLAADQVTAASSDAQPLVVPALTEDTTQRALAVVDPRTVELGFLRAAVNPNLLDYAHLEVANLDSLRSMSDGTGGFLGLRNYPGQPLVNSGTRAELSVDYPFSEGQTIRYSWRFGITQDFKADASNRWWLFGDWHDQPNRNIGETWTGFAAHSPSIGFGYGQIDGQDYLALLYGTPNPTTRGLIPFSRGVWHTMTVDITWSRGANGRVAVYLNGKLVQQAVGGNMYNNFQHYLKLGTYRDPAIASDTWVYVRDVNIQRIK